MNANLLSLSLDTLGCDFRRQLGTFLRESQNATRSALDLLLPVVIGRLAQKGATLEGGAELASLVDAAQLDVTLLESIEGLFASPVSNVNRLLKVGTSRLVPWLFGDASASLVNAISTVSGIRRSSATTLLAMIVPIVLTVVKKHVGDMGLGANSLSSLLRSQRANVRYKLDSRITAAMGFADPSDFPDELSSRLKPEAASANGAALVAPNAAVGAAAMTKSWPARWLPWRSLASERWI
jgi:Bacterial protein of unknown function (DUF937)